MSLKSRAIQILFKNVIIRRAITTVVRKAGFDLIRGLQAPAALLRYFDINLIIDVGANEGQFGKWVRGIGYTGRIVSIEPVSTAYNALQRSIAHDPKWTAMRLAIGREEGFLKIHVAENSVYSSALPRAQFLVESDDSSTYIRSEMVEQRTIDGILDSVSNIGDRILLKIDTQGFEREVLAGAVSSLPKLTGVLLELSFLALYEGEPLSKEMIETLGGYGFSLVSLQPLMYGNLCQGDGMFFRVK